MKKAKKATPRMARRPTVDLIAREGAFGKRLRKLEEALNLTAPNSGISLALVVCSGPNNGFWSSPEGVHVGRGGHVTGVYRLGLYRDVVFWGPRGYSLEETAAIHRRKVAEMLTDPEYAEPPPESKTLRGEHSVRLRLGDGAAVIVSGEPEPGERMGSWAERSRGLLREVNGAVVIRNDNQPWR